MRISLLAITEPLKIKLLAYPDLVNSLKNKDPNFINLLETWLKETEIILKKNNILQCAKIASLRSKIISPIFDEFKGRSTRKRQLHIAAESMYEIQHTILSVITPYEKKVNDARDIIKNLLSVLMQSGAIKYTNGTDFQYFINQIWKLFSTHEQLKPSIINVLTLIPQVDALRIIAEEIELTEWK